MGQDFEGGHGATRSKPPARGQEDVRKRRIRSSAPDDDRGAAKKTAGDDGRSHGRGEQERPHPENGTVWNDAAPYEGRQTDAGDGLSRSIDCREEKTGGEARRNRRKSRGHPSRGKKTRARNHRKIGDR